MKELIRTIFTTRQQDLLLDQYYVPLQVNVNRLKKKNLLPDDAIERIDQLLEKEKSWDMAYRIELEIANYFDEDILDIELHRSLGEYKARFSDDSYLKMKKNITPGNQVQQRSKERRISQKRTLLIQIIQELQWFFAKRNQKRDLVLLTRIRTSVLFVGSFLLFVLSLWFYVHFPSDYIIVSTKALIVATLAGALGATFSMLTGLQSIVESSLSELKLRHRFNYLLIRSFTGVCAALIFYFFIQSDLVPIEKGLLPELPVELKAGDVDISTTYKNLSMLIVWCFIVGFSEKLVPTLISKTADRISTSK